MRKLIYAVALNIALITPSLAQVPPPATHQHFLGTLTLDNDNPLGNPASTLEMAGGSTLNLKPGIEIANQITIKDAQDMIKPPGFNQPLPNNRPPATIHIENGSATLNGMVHSTETVNKTGAGTLKLNSISFSTIDLNALQGGIQVNNIWMSHLNSAVNTIISGTGYITSANIAGKLNPGTASTPGQIMINELTLAPTATTNIRIQNGTHDSIYSADSARLNGTLHIHAESIPRDTYVIVESENLHNSRFAHVQSPKTYISPTIKYNDRQICNPGDACQTVTLSMQYNTRGLNYTTPNWQAATIMDSRFIRDAANANMASGKTWARTWFANTEWHKTDRDTSGIQIGHSININRNNQIALFTGAQHTNWRKDLHANDTAIYAGMAYSHANDIAQIKLGYSISQHKGKIQRQADPHESAIKSRPKATNQQSWIHISPTLPIPINVYPAWNIKPYMQITHINTKLRSYHETDSLAAIQSPSQNQEFWLGQIGINIENQWDTQHGPAIFQMHFGVKHNFSKNYVTNKQKYRMDNQTHTVHSHKMPKTSLLIDLGVNAPIAKHSTAQLSYTAEHGKHTKQHGIWAGVNVKF